MFQSLTVENFQKHDTKTVDFNPEITVLVGCTESGKSTLIRALYWVCLNQPAGDWFLKHGESQAHAQLVLDQKVVTRYRGKDKNSYSLGAKEFLAISQNVPSEIKELLNISELNFQMQLDRHFLLSENAGDIAKTLNKIINLELIDKAVGNAANEVKNANSTLKHVEQRHAKAKESFDNLKWVPKLNEELKELESLSKQLAILQSKKDSLGNLLSKITISYRTKKSLEGVVEDGKNLLGIGESRQSIKKRLTSLGNLLTRLKQNQPKEVPNLQELNKFREKVDKFAERNRCLHVLLADIEEAELTESRYLEQLKAAQDKLKEFKICPQCEQPLPSSPAISTSPLRRPLRVRVKKTGSEYNEDT